MSGPYAHITLVHISKPPAQAKYAYGAYLRLVEFGSIGPDYPCFSPSGQNWADAMHSISPGTMSQVAEKRLKQMWGPKKDKCLAWLLGYMAHVATDLTIHPVVQTIAKGFPDHSICEINQDAWAFGRLQIGEIHQAKPLSEIDKCFSRTKGYELDPDIEGFWSDLLQEVYPAEWTNSKPDFSQWHKTFQLVVNDLLSGNVLPFGRHCNTGVYPDRKNVDNKYISNLSIPSPPGALQDYDNIFNRAIASTEKLWDEVVSAVLQGSNQLSGTWTLDTGMDQANKMVFWG